MGYKDFGTRRPQHHPHVQNSAAYRAFCVDTDRMVSTPDPLPTAETLDEVIESIDVIVRWSIAASSRLGYFAALYKRITKAVKVAVEQGAFEDPARMERFDVAFANRYLDAVNGHFHPGWYPRPPHSWQITFDAAARREPIIVQHLLGGVNAHIGLDLGIVAQTIAPGAQLPSLQDDFDRINAVLASQVTGIVEKINELSPVLAQLYAVLKDNEINLIAQTLISFRDSAWRFATLLAMQPKVLRPATILARDLHIAQQGLAMYDPPPPLDGIVAAIAARESREVAHNVDALDQIARTLAPIETTL